VKPVPTTRRMFHLKKLKLPFENVGEFMLLDYVVQ